MLEYIILGFLMKEEMSGYDLKQWMANCTSYFFDASFGSIYPALKRLEEKGYISCHEVVESSKFKKLYAITDMGKTSFLSWLETPIVFSKTKQEHLVHFYFYQYLPKEKAILNLKTFISEVELCFNQLSKQKSDLEEAYDVNQLTFVYSTMVYGIRYYQFIIDWCKNLLIQIEGEKI
ncbi:PadR family transcriptional regulator [Sinanaerobacter sp. ZZT-01]|uniref:PadR family transcriptional regulator n=1 Tax=Sinanaerobacter sp. ZZT-01 TaxID=3111540 RepID=UPI002D765E18|nr:PadR family transcriptional regulator [Sinanaerobacter sp. ZZT-01]WRR93793.1 PadR family transcriptional regulator [Sinanaerobacter sp. ZZT-01]